MLQTEIVHTKDFESSSETIFTDCYYEFTPSDVDSIVYARELLKTLSNIKEMSLLYVGMIQLIAETGEECKISNILMEVSKDSCYLSITDVDKNKFKILTNY